MTVSAYAFYPCTARHSFGLWRSLCQGQQGCDISRLTLIPAQGSDKRPVSYRFIEAVQRLTPNFPKDTWSKLYEKVGARLHMGQLKRTFVILSDEDRASGRDSGLASGANSVPVSGRGGRRGGRGLATRGGRGGHDGSGPSNKRGPEDILSATPAKTTRRGK